MGIISSRNNQQISKSDQNIDKNVKTESNWKWKTTISFVIAKPQLILSLFPIIYHTSDIMDWYMGREHNIYTNNNR